MAEYFEYGEEETSYLSRRDRRLARVIEEVPHINWPLVSDVFSCICFVIIGQQVSIKAQESIWARIQSETGGLTPEKVLEMGEDGVRSFGLTRAKAAAIFDLSSKVVSGEFSPEALSGMSDDEAMDRLLELKGVGVWTAEMVLMFSLQRRDVFSRGDLVIIRGIRMIYRRKEVTDAFFETLRKRFSPYGSVASLYIWEVGEGRAPGYSDPAKESKKGRKVAPASPRAPRKGPRRDRRTPPPP